MCDIILASPTAKFGQPEINLGVIPGGGGTQRLTRIVGKSRAMELMLTGRTFSAEEAERWGVVSRVVGPGEGEVVNQAVEMAKEIARKSQIAVQAGHEAVNAGTRLLVSPPFLANSKRLCQPWNCHCRKDSSMKGDCSIASLLLVTRRK